MLNFLNKIFSAKKFRRLFINKEKGVLGIDIGSSSIKIVHLVEREGRVVLENYGELALGPYVGLSVGQTTSLDQPQIKTALIDIFREADITAIAGKYAALSIPMSVAFLSLIELPKVDNKQLQSMIPIEARKYIPMAIDEVVLDWWILPQQNNGTEEVVGTNKKRTQKAQVLLAAIHNDTIDKYRKIQDCLGLVSNSFEIDIFSAIRSVAGKDHLPALVIDMGAGTTKLAIVNFGVPCMQRIINIGSQEISATLSKTLHLNINKAEDIKREQGLLSNNVEAVATMQLSLNHIITEINKFIINYKKKNTQPINKIVLIGGGALLRGLSDFMQKSINIKIEKGDPFSKIEVPTPLRVILKEVGPEFSVAIGLALKALQD
ncbi:MAG: type IV pilus assembly protein PilM [Patescibacteria group bacterium]